ncbi:hypothetical protein FCV25MIE_07296 [Fagus crenata]
MRTVAVWAQTQRDSGRCWRWEGEKDWALGIEDGEQPLHVSNRRFEKVRDLSKIGGGGGREHLAEYAAGHARGSWPRQQRFGSDRTVERSGAFDPGGADRRRLRERLDGES